MKKLTRHTLPFGRLLLALVFALASIMPAGMHTSAMAGPSAAGGHHHAGLTGDKTAHAAHHQHGEQVDLETGEPCHHPANADEAVDQCCPASCFSAIGGLIVDDVSVFVPDSFEVEPMRGLVAVTTALPERPPRA